MREIAFRLVFMPDATYAIDLTMPDGAQQLIKSFAREADAEAWLAEQMHKCARDEVWIRQPMMHLRAWRPMLTLNTMQLSLQHPSKCG